MNDLIDRQAAIDALSRFSLGETDAIKLAFRMGDYLKRLPSAQSEIIRCKDCKHRDQEDKKCDCGMQWCVFPKRDDDFCSFAERRTDE